MQNGIPFCLLKSITFPDLIIYVEDIFGLLFLFRLVCDLGMFPKFVGLGMLNSGSEADSAE
jgi:hypothetical protein